MRFFVGLHQPSDAKHFDGCMISINRLRARKSDFATGDWMLDSGAFTELEKHHRWRDGPEVYADQVRRWARCGRLLAAAAQDWICAPLVIERTGLSVAEHQRLTIERYEALRALVPDVYVLPTLQGYSPASYVEHVRAYGDLLPPGAWVGVGSLASRSSRIDEVAAILGGIKAERPDLRLHGFALKLRACMSAEIVALLHSADSMAWSSAARREGRSAGANDWREAAAYAAKVAALVGEHSDDTTQRVDSETM